MARIIAISNQKGGVGKTTTAVNLSAYVAAEGKRTLLVDLDPQGNATSGLGVVMEKDDASIYDVIMNEMPFDEAIVDLDYSPLKLLPAGIDLVGLELELADAPRSRLRDVLAPARDVFDYIFIDCPPSLGLLTLNALTAADGVLVPIQCEYYALEGMTQLMNTMDIVKKSLNPSLELTGIALTMYDGRTNLSSQVVTEVRAHFPEQAFETLIPRNVRLSEAPSYGLPIGEYDGKCAGAISYRDLARELIARTK